MGKADKGSVYEELKQNYDLKDEEIMYVFDDVLDLPIAKQCGLRIMINRYASPLFYHHVKSEGLADYISFNEGGENAVRECCELLIGINGNYSEIMQKRADFKGDYSAYLEQRQLIPTKEN